MSTLSSRRRDTVTSITLSRAQSSLATPSSIKSKSLRCPAVSLRETDAVLKRGLKNSILASVDLAVVFQAVYNFIIDKSAQR